MAGVVVRAGLDHQDVVFRNSERPLPSAHAFQLHNDYVDLKPDRMAK
jgi:hypothetical protein